MLFERGGIGVLLCVDAMGARGGDEFGHVVCVKTLGRGAMSDIQSGFVDAGVGFGGAHFIGEDLIVEEGENGVVLGDKLVVGGACVRKQDESLAAFFDGLDEGEDGGVGCENIGGGAEELFGSKGAWRGVLEKIVESFVGYFSCLIAVAQFFLDEEELELLRSESCASGNLGEHFWMAEKNNHIPEVEEDGFNHASNI